MINLIFGDCLVEMKSIADNSIDFICCDLPYGVTASNWDSIIDFNKLWLEYNRLIKSTGTIALFSSQPFTTKLINSNIKNFRYCWYWLKNQGTNFFHAKIMPIRKIEEICIFNKGKYYPQITDGHIPTNSAKGISKGKVYHGKNERNSKGKKTTRYPVNVLEFKCVDNYSRLHPNQKPIDLISYLINTYTDENDVVLDNTMGVGTVGIACKKLNRKFIGIENNKKYFKIAEDIIIH